MGRGIVTWGWERLHVKTKEISCVYSVPWNGAKGHTALLEQDPSNYIL